MFRGPPERSSRTTWLRSADLVFVTACVVSHAPLLLARVYQQKLSASISES